MLFLLNKNVAHIGHQKVLSFLELSRRKTRLCWSPRWALSSYHNMIISSNVFSSLPYSSQHVHYFILVEATLELYKKHFPCFVVFSPSYACYQKTIWQVFVTRFLSPSPRLLWGDIPSLCCLIVKYNSAFLRTCGMQSSPATAIPHKQFANLQVAHPWNSFVILW